jgi:hypothetical protein
VGRGKHKGMDGHVMAFLGLANDAEDEVGELGRGLEKRTWYAFLSTRERQSCVRFPRKPWHLGWRLPGLRREQSLWHHSRDRCARALARCAGRGVFGRGRCAMDGSHWVVQSHPHRGQVTRIDIGRGNHREICIDN